MSCGIIEEEYLLIIIVQTDNLFGFIALNFFPKGTFISKPAYSLAQELCTVKKMFRDVPSCHRSRSKTIILKCIYVELYEFKRKELLDNYEVISLNLAGDGRFNSPGKFRL